MAYKCRVCGVNDVDKPGEVCELCAIGQDPYVQSFSQGSQPIPQIKLSNNNQDNSSSYTPKRSANRKVLLNGGSTLANQDPYGNVISTFPAQQSVQVYSAGQVPQMTQQTTTVSNTQATVTTPGNKPITEGITKNISIDNRKRTFLTKWFRALFTGIPFTLDDEVIMFQVFPDFTGTSLNALGNACDQVIIYGRLNHGAISENNDIEVYGRRDSNNNVIAKMIKNKASGTTIVPSRTLGQAGVWVITALTVVLLGMLISMLGVVGVVWAIVFILCLTNLPKTLKILGIIFGAIFSFIKRIF